MRRIIGSWNARSIIFYRRTSHEKEQPRRSMRDLTVNNKRDDISNANRKSKDDKQTRTKINRSFVRSEDNNSQNELK